MYRVDTHEMSDAFFPIWQAAALHLGKQVDGGIQSWLRSHPYPPFLEHLSFRLGNQLFFVRIEDVDGKVLGPGNPRGVITAARQANGHACVLPMKKRVFGDSWVAEMPRWGLIDAVTRQPVDPVALISDQKIEMTEWEVHDLAVQVVRDYLKREGFELMSWQGNPGVDPAIWFIGTSRRPEWVVVRSAKFPADSASKPSNWQDIVTGCSKMSTIGHFASVAVVSVNQLFRSDNEQPVPLWRGHGMHVRFTGLEKCS
jgi:hypothetical protein